jgi:hypothetical protein
VLGTSINNIGVYGSSGFRDGVVGQSFSGGSGVAGLSNMGPGVQGGNNGKDFDIKDVFNDCQVSMFND